LIALGKNKFNNVVHPAATPLVLGTSRELLPDYEICKYSTINRQKQK
jgi:hypothetical protein